MGKIRERFRGRQFWRYINKVVFFGLYTLFIIGIMEFPQYLHYLILGYFVAIPTYIALVLDHLREMEKRRVEN